MRSRSMDELLHVISRQRVSTLVLATVAPFVAIYLFISLSLLLFGHNFRLLDIATVLIAMLLAVLIPAFNAAIRLPAYQLPDRLRSRENLGWGAIATAALLNLGGRLIYAGYELSAGGANESITIADALFGLSVPALVAGVLLIPWSEGRGSTTSFLLDVTVALIALASIFWPLLVGPAVHGEFTVILENPTLAIYLIGTFTLALVLLWIVMRDVRRTLWPVAAAVAATVVAMIVLNSSLFPSMATASAIGWGDGPLLLINAASTLMFLMLALAGILRLRSVFVREPEVSEETTSVPQVATWQMMFPYSLITILVILRLFMELFDWRTEYRTEMVVGIGIGAILLMVRQWQVVRHNRMMFRQVAEASVRDGLTGLYNHRMMHDLLNTEVSQAERNGGSLAVIFIDIDYFKQFNDTYGHKQGDSLLATFASILEREVRKGDLVGRYGGEEFMIIAPDISNQGARELAERLRRSIEQQEFIHNGDRSNVTVSLGVAGYPLNGLHPEELIDRADQAMYRAKRAGRNQTMVYDTA